MLPGPIFTVSTRVSRYQVQSKTSLHLTSHLTWPIALSPRAWHLGKNYFHSLGGSPFRYSVKRPEGLTPMLKMMFSTGHPENRTFGLGTERKMPGAGREREGAGQTRGEVK